MSQPNQNQRNQIPAPNASAHVGQRVKFIDPVTGIMLYGEVVDIAKEAGALIRTVKVRRADGQFDFIDVTRTVVEAVEIIEQAAPTAVKIWNWVKSIFRKKNRA